MFIKKGKLKLVFILIFTLAAVIFTGWMILTNIIKNSFIFGDDVTSEMLRTRNVDSCWGRTDCIFEFIDTTKSKDDKLCAGIKNYYDWKQTKCYSLMAANSGDEKFCEKMETSARELESCRLGDQNCQNDIAAIMREAEHCRLGIKLIGKELILNQGWTINDYHGPTNNAFYADQVAFIGSFDIDKGGYEPEKILVLELPVKIVLLELDTKKYLSMPSIINWNDKYSTRFQGAKVKIMDGKNAGKEGWLHFWAIEKNQPLGLVNEKP